jgi:hypothetical protein
MLSKFFFAQVLTFSAWIISKIFLKFLPDAPAKFQGGGGPPLAIFEEWWIWDGGSLEAPRPHLPCEKCMKNKWPMATFLFKYDSKSFIFLYFYFYIFNIFQGQTNLFAGSMWPAKCLFKTPALVCRPLMKPRNSG